MINIQGKTNFGPPSIITDELTLYLDAANTKSYPGTDTLWKDLSGHDNNGVSSGGVTNVDDYINFDGNNGSMTVGLSSEIYPNNTDYTYNSWLYFPGYTGTYRQIFFNNAGGGHIGIGMLLQSNADTMRIEIYGSLGNRQVKTISTVNHLESWNQWSFVLHQSTYTIDVYINGLYSETLSYNNWGVVDAQYSLRIGSHSNTVY